VRGDEIRCYARDWIGSCLDFYNVTTLLCKVGYF